MILEVQAMVEKGASKEKELLVFLLKKRMLIRTTNRTCHNVAGLFSHFFHSLNTVSLNLSIRMAFVTGKKVKK